MNFSSVSSTLAGKECIEKCIEVNAVQNSEHKLIKTKSSQVFVYISLLHICINPR
ncbi:hypothetical protein Scep_005736 [Stephania cephalantha]|uniref:Uncharacterized protein n=1 Tax=Stephania cephalantha TaxID=152367 RepID=A0AAP0KUX6_9MAGN